MKKILLLLTLIPGSLFCADAGPGAGAGAKDDSKKALAAPTVGATPAAAPAVGAETAKTLAQCSYKDLEFMAKTLMWGLKKYDDETREVADTRYTQCIGDLDRIHQEKQRREKRSPEEAAITAAELARLSAKELLAIIQADNPLCEYVSKRTYGYFDKYYNQRLRDDTYAVTQYVQLAREAYRKKTKYSAWM